jgi:hypothetical protein
VAWGFARATETFAVTASGFISAARDLARELQSNPNGQAVEALRGGLTKPDVVFLDLRITRLDGLGVLRVI